MDSKFKMNVIIHGPSVGIGAGITAVVIIAVFFGFSSTINQPEIALESTGTPESDHPRLHFQCLQKMVHLF